MDPPPPRLTLMRIYFATNRDPDDTARPTTFHNRFSAEGLTDLRFGWATMSGDEFDHYDLTVATESLAVDPDRANRGDLSGQVLGSQAVFDEVRQDMASTRQDCCIFIHGFNTDFRSALQTAARLKAFYAARPMAIFVFTWPSDGSMLPFKAYASDRDDARASGTAFGRGLQKLAHFLRGVSRDEYCEQRIHLLAHSMGNYVLRWAVQNIATSSGSGLRRLLDQVLLFAADEDDDAIELDHKLKALPDMARRVTVYHNPSDKALVVSDATKGNPDRLGAGGPRNARALPDKVSVVNCEPTLSFKEDATGHGYYLCNDIVRRDVLAVLDGTDPHAVKTRRYVPETRGYRLKRG
jgi:esterase/lipase superfamily enzyme